MALDLHATPAAELVEFANLKELVEDTIPNVDIKSP